MSDSLFEIDYLANKKEHIKACAAWAYGRWGVQKKEGSLDRALNVFSLGAQIDELPLTLVAYTKESNLPVAMASLWAHDSEEWPDVTPWIASVYTLYRYRGQGLAGRLIKGLEQEARRLGFKSLYLQSGSAAGLYRKLGYTEMETRYTDTTAAGTITLFKKEL